MPKLSVFITYMISDPILITESLVTNRTQMTMTELISRISTISILIAMFTVGGCGGSGSDDSGLSAPAGAVTITDANAYSVVQDAISGSSALVGALGVEASELPGPMAVINIVQDKLDNRSPVAALSTPTGVETTEPCTDGGWITTNANDQDTAGSITFSECNEGGVIINGTINFSVTANQNTGDFTMTLSGNLSATDGIETMSINGLAFSTSGNIYASGITINTYTYAADFPGGGGFLVQLQAPIVIDTMSGTCPDSGIILITGAAGTQAKATINADDTVTIEVNDGGGIFVPVTDINNPYPCTDFF